MFSDSTNLDVGDPSTLSNVQFESTRISAIQNIDQSDFVVDANPLNDESVQPLPEENVVQNIVGKMSKCAKKEIEKSLPVTHSNDEQCEPSSSKCDEKEKEEEKKTPNRTESSGSIAIRRQICC